MKKAFKIIFLSFLVVLCSAVGFAYYYAANNGEKIKQLVIVELNKSLKSEVKVDEVSFSFWNSFPKASVVFTKVAIADVLQPKDTLIYLEKLACNFDIYEIINKKYNLKEVEFEGGFSKFFINKKGAENYIFWESKESDSTNVKINLESVKIKSVGFNYLDVKHKTKLDFFISEMNLKGIFHIPIYDLEIKSELKNTNLAYDNVSLVKDRTIFLFSEGSVNQEKRDITFNDINLGVDGMNFLSKGYLSYENEVKVDFDISAKQANLEKAIKLLPKESRKALQNFEIKGEADVVAKIHGIASSSKNPNYDASFKVSNGTLSKKGSNLSFQNVNLNAKFTNGKKQNLSTSSVVVENFAAKINQGYLNGSFSIQNLKNPKYNYQAKALFELKNLVELLDVKELQNPKGLLEVEVNSFGKLENFDKYELNDWQKAKTTATINLKEIGFNQSNSWLKLSNLNADIKLDNKQFSTQNLSAIANNVEFQAKGKVNHLIAFLSKKQQTLFVDASVQSQEFNWNNFKEQITTKEKQEFALPKEVAIYLNTSIDKLVVNKSVMVNYYSENILKPNKIDVRNCSFETLGGKVDGNLFLKLEKEKIKTHINLNTNKIEVSELFEDFDNFQLNSIQHHNLSGKLDAEVSYSSEWDRFWNINSKSIKADANMLINQGRLKNLESLKPLSRFVELEELMDIKFKRLQNQISVQNEMVYIPTFDIYSSAINMELSGKHGFDNKIDYRITLILDKLLGKKAKKPKENDYGYVEDDGLGKTRLFLKMDGTVDDPNIKYDTKKLKKHWSKKVVEEKNTIKRILQEEFGLFKKDSIKKKESKQSRRFNVEWEENGKLDKEKEEPRKKKKEKGKFGKFLDKIAQPNSEEYEEPSEN